jgi:tRNA1Val (adenine37-N6)-methyltransferase
MTDPCFNFKQFTVRHEKCAMKVGTDGVLLGAWTDVVGVKHALDVGTGTGLIALMLAQRSDARIDAVEIDEQAFYQAQENVAASPWSDRITLCHISFQQYAAREHGKKYDLIVSNPPYYSNSLKPSSKPMAQARHDTSLTLEALIFHARALMSPEGRISLIIPSDVAARLIDLAFVYGLYPRRHLYIRPKAGKAISRCLIELTCKCVPETNESTLSILQDTSGEFTAAYRELTRAFYLNF